MKRIYFEKKRKNIPVYKHSYTEVQHFANIFTTTDLLEIGEDHTPQRSQIHKSENVYIVPEDDDTSDLEIDHTPVDVRLILTERPTYPLKMEYLRPR